MEPTGRDEMRLAQGVRAGDRVALGRAISLIESTRPAHQPDARALIAALLPHTCGAHRVGISGVPGVGKSTFIEALGMHLVGHGHRVAVLAVDPSSPATGGSILGDKTRMPRLAAHPAAFVRPSPSGGSLGGIARRTREALLVCEAAGFDIVLVETVGVGQSEAVVGEVVDLFLLLTLPGAGDELQGIKRGILEVVDAVAVNKADGERLAAAERARTELTAALRILRDAPGSTPPPVLLASARDGTGIQELWDTLRALLESRRISGARESRRRNQRIHGLRALLEERLLSWVHAHASARELLTRLEPEVAAGRCPPTEAVDQVLAALGIGGLGASADRA